MCCPTGHRTSRERDPCWSCPFVLQRHGITLLHMPPCSRWTKPLAALRMDRFPPTPSVIAFSYLLHLDTPIHPFRLAVSGKPFLLTPMAGTALSHTARLLSMSSPSHREHLEGGYSFTVISAETGDGQACNRKSIKMTTSRS